MIDWTKPVRTKGSKEIVRVLCTDGKLDTCPVIIEDSNGYLEHYTKDGRYLGDVDSKYDLENVPEETSTPTEVMLLVVDGIASVSATYWNMGESALPNERWGKFREVKE